MRNTPATATTEVNDNPNVSNPVGKIRSSKVLIILLAILLFIVASSVYLLFFRSDKTKPSVTPKTTSKTAPSSSWESMHNTYLDLAEKASDPKQSLSYYQKAFLALSADYNTNPTSQKRKSLESLAKIIQAKFPDQTKFISLDIPCREKECGAVFEYSEKLSEIRNDIQNNKKMDSEVRKVLLLNLENAALAAGKNNTETQLNILTSIYTNLQIEWQRTDDKSIEAIAQKVSALLDEIDPNRAEIKVELKKL